MKKFFVYHRVVINDTQCLYTHLVHLVSQPLCVFSLQLVGKIKTRKYHSGFLPLLIAHVCLLSSEHLTSVQTNLNSAKSLVGGSLSLTVFFSFGSLSVKNSIVGRTMNLLEKENPFK